MSLPLLPLLLERFCGFYGPYKFRILTPTKVAKKRGRPAKGEKRAPAEPKRLEVQRSQSAQDAIALLPAVCDRGTKKNERSNGRFKDEFGGRTVQVRGPDKVMMPLMFGILALCADQLIKITDC